MICGYYYLRHLLVVSSPNCTDLLQYYCVGIISNRLIGAGVGVKTSSYMNSFLTLINLGVMAVIVVAGFYYGNSDNWFKQGLFDQFGFTGVISGAATCFYAYVGFDSIATSGEEAKDPAYSIPVATIIAMSVVCTSMLAYQFGIANIWYSTGLFR